MSDWIFARLEKMLLWQRFEKTATPEQLVNVKELILSAAPMLDLVRDTFPTYTLHNHVHAENVVSIMGDLLGEALERITALEAAMLVLSAYFHDIGMVFKETEVNNLRNEAGFNEFLEKHPDQYVKAAKAADIPLDVAENYCRWIHADRVKVYLDEIEKTSPNLLKWGSPSFKNPLESLCRSHNLAVSCLKDRTMYPIDFLYQADLYFCSILLRLADILDFDNSRSPESVYRFLNLETRNEPRKAMSDIEWRKHLFCDGFKFPPTPRQPNYELGFVAGPDSPAVEHDARQFLDTIEKELRLCREALSFCSDKWRSFILPGSINRYNIVSNGYKYGEHRFTLDQDQVLDLFMGENLYEDPYVFVRELLQNAIDTSRHREHFERCQGNKNFSADPITVTDWQDNEGRQWVRFDDYGMGMDENIIIRYLLKVGVSYYRSSDFEAEKIRYSGTNDSGFTPISRFGIGLLSCFMVADRLEISTRRVKTDGGSPAPVRLSLPGLHGFYTLQTGNHTPAPMPSKQYNEFGYRAKFGTSIALRIDPLKGNINMNLLKLLNTYLLLSPIPVNYNEKPVNDIPLSFIEKSLIEKIFIYTFSENQVQEVENVLDLKIENEIKIYIFPLDITKHSPRQELKGQGIVGYVECIDIEHMLAERVDDYDVNGYSYDVELDIGENGIVYFKASFITNEFLEKHSTLYDKEYSINILDLNNSGINLINSHLATINSKYLNRNMAFQMLSYNGIFIFDNSKYDLRHGSYNSINFNCDKFFSKAYFISSIIYLSDSFLPDISISRDYIKSLSWPMMISMDLSLAKIAKEYINELCQFLTIHNYNYNFFKNKNMNTVKILQEQCKTLLSEFSDVPYIKTSNSVLSINEINIELLANNPISIESIYNIFSPHEIIQAILIYNNFLVEFYIENNSGKLLLKFKNQPIEDANLSFFPPLFFVPYINSIKLRFNNFPINSNHPFSVWLLKSASILNTKCQSLLSILMDALQFSPSQIEIGISTINRILATIRNLKMPEIIMPTNFNITADDFEFDIPDD